MTDSPLCEPVRLSAYWAYQLKYDRASISSIAASKITMAHGTILSVLVHANPRYRAATRAKATINQMVMR
jgi:hypothetical protein